MSHYDCDSRPFCDERIDELEAAKAEIERLQAEVVEWKKEAGKFGAGCPACDDIGEENERLRTEPKLSDFLEWLRERYGDHPAHFAAQMYTDSLLVCGDEQSTKES